MEHDHLYHKSVFYLKTLCEEIPERCVGSEGNRRATSFFAKEISALGWRTETSELEVMDWQESGATLRVADQGFNVLPSPYALGCSVQAPLTGASSIKELQDKEIAGHILLLSGEIAKEQLMPKNFVFYNPQEHQKIIALLEKKQPAAIICATGRNPSLAGGAYPFPLIEDGDINIPSVYTTDKVGQNLLACIGKTAVLESRATRIPAKAYNIIARKGKETAERIVVTAHIDAKKGTPGAIDNATGVVTLLILAGLLKDYDGDRMIEMAAFNGEDYYAAPGQMEYIRKNHGDFQNIVLNINIDGAGLKESKTAISFYDLPDPMKMTGHDLVTKFTGIVEGVQWPQGDHSIFIQHGCPAIAVSSQWLIDHMDNQEITHTPQDNMDIVDCRKLVKMAEALNWFLREPNRSRSALPHPPIAVDIASCLCAGDALMTDELIFRTRQDFRDWLSSTGSTQGVWLVFGKDDSLLTLSPSEALEEALCFGWIDGLIKKIDGSRYKKYFSPRRKGSRWSEKNKKLVAKLIRDRAMTSSGLEVIEQAKKDGKWNVVHSRTIPDEKYVEFEALISKSKKAFENYTKMPKSTKQQFVGLYFEAKKEETRIRKLAKLIDLLEQNKKPM